MRRQSPERRESAKCALAMEELFEEEAGKAAGVVAEDGVFLEKIVKDNAEAKPLEFGQIDRYRFSALGAVAPGHFGRNRLAIGNNPINDAMADVFLDGAEMIGESVAGSFAGLGHEIGDVHAGRLGLGDRAGDFGDQEIRKDAGVERTRTEEDQVGLLDGFDGLGERPHTARRELEFLDWRAAGGDAGFAVDDAAIFERGNEMNI